MDWRERETQEKSLSQVYWKARKVASSRTNFFAAVFTAILFFAVIYADHRLALGLLLPGGISTIAREIGVLGFALTTAILGFLIAGFSIFASITRPEIFVALAQLDHKNSDLSRLKFIFFNFLFVFIHFLAFLAFSLCIQLLLPAIKNLILLPTVQAALSPTFIWWAGAVAVSITVGWFAFLIMLLKSFIWNIYQAVLLVIVTADLIAPTEKRNEP